MKIKIEASYSELVAHEDVIKAHVDDLIVEAREASASQAMAKAFSPVIKPNPNRTIEEMKRRWLDAYESQMKAMQKDIGDLLNRVGSRTP